MKTTVFAGALALLVGASGSVRADDDLRSLSVPWSDKNATTIGSGLDVDLIDQQRFTCLKVGDSDLKWLDGLGAVQTTSTIELVSDYKSLANTLNLEVDYKSKADVGIAALKAGGSVNLNMKYESFAKNEGRTLALVIKAQSNFGRKGLTQYTLDKPFDDLVKAGDFKTFRARCGTHTVVAQRNQAMVAAVLQLSDISQESRQALESTYTSSFSGGGTISGLAMSASTEMQAKWKSLVQAAYRLGTMQITFETKGGAGISDSFRLAVSADPTKIDTILGALNSIGPSFTQQTSAPVAYLLVSNTVFGVQNKVSDISKLDALNGYYLQLARVDAALARIDGYQTTFPALSTVYATSPGLLKLRAYRSQLVTAVENCVLRDDCSFTPPKELGVLFAEDIVTSSALKLQCLYKRFDSTDGKVRLNVLNNAAVVLRGKARLTSFVSLPTALLTRLGPESVPPRQMVTAWQAFAMSEPDANGLVDVIAQIDNQTFNPTVDIGTGSVNITNEADLTRLRADMLGSIYTVNMQLQNGLFIQNAVGPAYGGDCPFKMVAQ